MKKTISLRMLLRSPVKTAVTLLLIAAASFLFLYNLLDYAMTKRNYDRTYAAYHGYFSMLRQEDREVETDANVGTFFLSDPAGNPAWVESVPYEDYHMRTVTAEDLEAIRSLPYVSRVERRYMTGGIAEYPRRFIKDGMAVVEFFNNISRVVFTATLDMEDPGIQGASFVDLFGTGYETGLRLRDVKVLAGKEESLEQNRYYINNKRLGVSVPVIYPEHVGERNAFNGLYSRVSCFSGNCLTPEDLEALVPGQRYVFVASVDPYQVSAVGISEDEDSMYHYAYVYLGDDSVYGTCDIITPLEGEPESWLETPKFAGLRKMMEIIERDRYTLDVHYVEDMQTIKRYQEGKLLPVQGRMLTAEDSENHNPVCVIPESMAEAYGLGLGDTLHLELGDKLMEQYAPFGAVAWSPQRYAENWVGQDFTVVGTFTETGLLRLENEDQFWAYGDNAVLVPTSFLPETADTRSHEFKPAELSYIIEDADSIIPFRDEVLPQLEEQGWYVYFFDGGWPAVRTQLRQTGTLSTVKLAAFAASAVLVLWLTVYLYILRKKKEYAVMRALGCPTRRAQMALLFPLLTLAVPAVVLGSLGAVLYTRAAAERNEAEFAILGLTMDTSIPLIVLLAGFGGSLILLLLLAWAALGSVAHKPPLELLQGGTNRNAGKQKALPPELKEDYELAPLPVLPEPVYHPHTSGKHTFRYVGRHMERTPIKSLLSLLLALALCFSIGFFTLLRETYRDLYQNIEIYPRFVSGFSNNKAKEVEKSGFVRDPYYEYRRLDCESNFVKDKLVLTTDLSRVTTAEITWREDKGPDMFTQSQAFCVVSRELADELGYTLGGKAEVCGYGYITGLRDSHPGLTYQELVDTVYHNYTHKFTIAGIAEETGKTVYAPIAAWQHFGSMFSDYVPLDLAEYTLLDYHHATQFRSYSWRLIYGTRAEFSMETGEADRIYQTYRLLELLYPIAFVLALVLGGVLPAGVILQSAREASLLRVLGTTKQRTRAMLGLEQVFLCILGLCLAIAVLALIKGSALLPVAGLVAIYAAAHLLICVLGTEIAAASVTRRNVLELLQVKE